MPTALAALLVAVSARSASHAEPVRIGLVLEQPLVGRADDPFQHSAYLGLARAASTLHVQGKVVAPAPNESYVPGFSYLARQGYDLSLGIGFDEIDDLARVAQRFPARKFAILDAQYTDLPHALPNVEGTLFKTEQPAYLAGYLAARMEDLRPAPHVLSSVAGFGIPPVKAYVAGFRAGAKRADPKITVLNTYANDFVNPSKCEHAAVDQIARGSGVVFDVAGACGIGALETAKKHGVWGIGVDIDQSYLGRFILTSVIKRLDVAVYDFASQLRAGEFRTGGDAEFDLRNHGVGLGRISPRVPARFRRELARLEAEIVAGRIKVPSTIR
ncbi:MAG TPA: BMP family ABC transporter substrate-binding protein [Gaiellaceae bacterium]|nr:BMP family ABC transporter substrate-binding protein [Gaiellaceae bacterium]